MTHKEAQRLALDDALYHHVQTTQVGQVPSEKILGGLYAGLRVVRDKMTADTLRSSDLIQLIAIALDGLAASYFDAAARGEDLSDTGPRRAPQQGNGN